jgi:hypothetical protein
VRPVSATVALRVFFQKVVEQFLTVVKIRALEPRQSIGKVEETALRRAREKAQGSGDLESFLQSHCGALRSSMRMRSAPRARTGGAVQPARSEGINILSNNWGRRPMWPISTR